MEEKVTLALAFSDTERCQQIIEKPKDYFTGNNLDFKIYLITADNEVQEWYLNKTRIKEKAAFQKKTWKKK